MGAIIRFVCFITLLGLHARVSIAHAASPLMEIKPTRLDHLPLRFDIHSERLQSGDIQFVVKITERTMKLEKPLIAQIRTVHVDNGSMLATPVRKLPVEWDDGSITCVFTVTEKELEDPDLSFYFGMWMHGIPNTDQFYAPLKNFMKP